MANIVLLIVIGWLLVGLGFIVSVNRMIKRTERANGTIEERLHSAMTYEEYWSRYRRANMMDDSREVERLDALWESAVSQLEKDYFGADTLASLSFEEYATLVANRMVR